MTANKLLGNRRRAETPRVETLPIAALRPNPKNPRKHSARQLKRLAALIREVGFINPVIVDESMMILLVTAGSRQRTNSASQQYQSSYSSI